MADDEYDGPIRMTDADAAFTSGMAAFEAKNFSQAMRFLNPVAEQGDPEALHRCAIMYQNGLGVVVDEQKAFAMMRAAASQGHALAQHGLGFMYMEGECVDQNGEEAVKWFRKAVDQGLVGSMTTLAMLYEEGRIVEKDELTVDNVTIVEENDDLVFDLRKPGVA